jgi:UDP-N-acetylmuramyl pentapeptide synthase
VAAFGAGAELIEDRSAVAAAARRLLAESATILVKGSRGAAMETVIADLRGAAAGHAATGEGATC